MALGRSGISTWFKFILGKIAFIEIRIRSNGHVSCDKVKGCEECHIAAQGRRESRGRGMSRNDGGGGEAEREEEEEEEEVRV